MPLPSEPRRLNVTRNRVKLYADMEKRERYRWGAQSIKALRRHLGLTQSDMAQHLGTRQQTVSEWETGMYQPRGTAQTLLTIIAERGNFRYQTGPDLEEEGASGGGSGHEGADRR